VIQLGATVDGLGRLKPDDAGAWAVALKGLEGKRVVVEIKRERNTRTLAQNKLLWGHVYTEAVAESADWCEIETGAHVFRTVEDVHGWAKLNFLRRPVRTTRGDLDLLGTTTRLTAEEFSRYVEHVVAKLAGFGVYIPPSGEGR
jgi:hypothetical protein